MTLYEALEDLKDPRRSQGQRNNLEQMLSMMVLSNLCGHFGGRPIATFAQIHESTFTQVLGLRHGVPSHVTFSDLLNRIDEQELIQRFNSWTTEYVALEQGEMVSGDGKVLGSTVSNPHGRDQDFQAIVSLFCQKSGLVYSLEKYRNASKDSEIDIVRFLISRLKDMKVTLFLDALHTQKKR